LFLCNGTCSPFGTTPWPLASPAFPTDGGAADGRRLAAAAPGAPGAPFAPGAAALRAALGDPASALAAFAAFRARAPAARAGATLTDVFAQVARFIAAAAAPPCCDGLDLACDISRVFDDHLPLVDFDDDAFADAPFKPVGGVPDDFLGRHLRGSSWRGLDCNGTDGSVYPGRAASAHAPAVDANCNGIAGVDAATGTPYEELFCSGENAPLGVAILGDSAAAHFHIPPQYLNARTFNLSGVVELAANEADWPQCSWATGWRNASDCPASKPLPGGLAPASIYQRMRARNRCAHRDFQNVGVNGARTGSMAPPKGIVNDLARDQAADAPLLVIYALIGNDVCDGHPGNGSWTTVADFKTNVLAALAVLDTTLPAGSHVAFLGLVDGRVLFDTTHALTHPLGLTYPEVYEFLSCNGCNPCWVRAAPKRAEKRGDAREARAQAQLTLPPPEPQGWLNTDEGWRNATSARAAALSAVYDDIIATKTFAHFDMYRLQVDWVKLIADFVAAGGAAADVIEPVDGFHPSQTGNYLLAEVTWQDLLANKPEFLGAVNPHNAAIDAIFGDQGGYV